MSKDHTIEKTETHNCKRSSPAKDGPKTGQKDPGPAGPGGPGEPTRPVFVAVRAPLWTRVASGY
jgi:hypothetical protein